MTSDKILERLLILENEKLVSRCMNKYMRLCDDLTVGFPLDSLMDLFSQDSVWEGKGSRYAKTFGRCDGKSEITAMFAKYTRAPAHFELNVHFLANEVINVEDNNATGTWMLLQPSTFSSGKSQLSCARITAKFVCVDESWLIDHFQTENVFSRPLDSQWNHDSLLPVPK